MHKQEHIHIHIWTMLGVRCSHDLLASPLIAFPLILGSYKQYWITLTPLRTNLVTLPKPYCFSYLFHYISIDYKQSNAPPSTQSMKKTTPNLTSILPSTYSVKSLSFKTPLEQQLHENYILHHGVTLTIMYKSNFRGDFWAKSYEILMLFPSPTGYKTTSFGQFFLY